MNYFMSSLNKAVEKINKENKYCLIMGDFNINLLNINSNAFPHEFLENFLTESFMPLISRPTRISNTSATLIDKIFSNIQTFFQSLRRSENPNAEISFAEYLESREWCESLLRGLFNRVGLVMDIQENEMESFVTINILQ